MAYTHTPEKTFSAPLRQSSISECLRCKRCFMFRHRWGLVPKSMSVPTAATRGRIIHAVLSFPVTPEGDKALTDWKAGTTAALEKLIAETGDPLGTLADQIAHFENTFAVAAMFRSLMAEKFAPPSYMQTLCTEEPVSFTFTSPELQAANVPVFTLSSRLDRLVLDTRPDSRSVWVRDFKTTERDPVQTLTGYAYSIQCRLYRMAAEAYLASCPLPDGAADVTGFILDVLRLPSITLSAADRDFKVVNKTLKSGPRKGETVAEKIYYGEPKLANYINRCAEWYDNNQYDAIQSYPIRYIGGALDKEFLSVLYTAHRYMNIEEPISANFPRDLTRSYCVNYGRVCDYYGLCSSDEAAWPSLIETRYTVVDPNTADAELYDVHHSIQ